MLEKGSKYVRIFQPFHDPLLQLRRILLREQHTAGSVCCLANRSLESLHKAFSIEHLHMVTAHRIHISQRGTSSTHRRELGEPRPAFFPTRPVATCYFSPFRRSLLGVENFTANLRCEYSKV